MFRHKKYCAVILNKTLFCMQIREAKKVSYEYSVRNYNNYNSKT